MSDYKVIEGFEVMRVTYAETMQELAQNKEKVHDREIVVVSIPPKMVVKIDNEFYSVNLVREVL